MPLAAVAGADLAAPRVGPLTVQFLLLEFIDPAAEDAHGPVVFLCWLRSSWQLDLDLLRRVLLVPQTHGRLGLVDVLAAAPPARIVSHSMSESLIST